MNKNKIKKFIDVTAPGKRPAIGHLHPLTQAMEKTGRIFESMGFEIADGPEMESEYYNFDALNIPSHHPARSMWDTFWLKEPSGHGAEIGQKLLLRTHVTSVDIRYLENNQPPIKIISMGRVFRNEATDATHETQFYQLDGLMINEKANMANLKAVMKAYFKEFFGDSDLEVRFRPSYFPFVEPAVEVDVKFGGKWLEVAGAGMVHPKVLEMAKLDSNKYQGFAFGMGLDRLVMVKHKIDDVRLFYSGDLRFIKQF
ncbi:MAG: phenylalanine--tRNA ligase subunit alpha [Candidatus Terrybacteria bacterium CG10_big_fil_rev_8_21_14_0_10_41_10]|uniref:phenylalanine--tRNA ligase n=1 Tax=Candidatus Terrybacteria bacterium CG10_big_fil_rev_8_21_14_0_10_41_10 TaxID=1975026 RepID=A0A2M8LAH5_9BACT|nr:MAG: phenylalanine--tRNA ligase subunit alpha [Candidatus Terrybacteria bacterium CG10_big_fil_rev_8_21_14_0_10_41_10]